MRFLSRSRMASRIWAVSARRPRASASGISDRNSRNSGRWSGSSLPAHGEAVALVERHQVHHRLAAVAALAVHVLEQVEGERARAVEQQDVALLQVVEVARGDLLQEAVEAVAVLLRQAALGVERGAHLRDGRLQLGSGIAEQGRKDLERALHEMNSVGVRTVLGRGGAEQARLGAPVRAAVAEREAARALEVVGVLAQLAVRGGDHEAVLVVGDRHDLVHVLDVRARQADALRDAPRRSTPSTVLARM